ncbi:MAG: indole-3-glycerol phosphate synthase TrpC [Chloroflexi bacterium]|nr:indole-3-glycerol phosphate synthase TrpC [Chloroflexota bacterium]
MTIVDDIAADVRRGLAERKHREPLAGLAGGLNIHGMPRDFGAALCGDGVRLIAEMKRASPSKGWLCPRLDAGMMALRYARGGAAAVSVLTERTRFKGDRADLTAARLATELPVLCKDFILDEYQIHEARFWGADAVLLIASLLSSDEMRAFIGMAEGLGMAALVEVHTEAEVEKALSAKAAIVGINNRSLADFSVDLGTTLTLRPLIPDGITVVSESGIRSRADISALRAAGVNAFLVGEALVTSPDPEARLQELVKG